MKYIYLILAILCLSSKSGIAATYYVNDNALTNDIYTSAIGNNGNTGLTPADPFATLAFAVSVAASGDVILVDAGNYTDINITIPSTLNNLTITGASISTTIFDGTAGSGIFLFMDIRGNNTDISNMTIQAYDNAGAIDIFASAGTSGTDTTFVNFTNCYFDRNETYGGFDTNPHGGAVYINSAGSNDPAAVSFYSCQLTNNISTQGNGGGAIYITGDSRLYMNDCRLTCNNQNELATTYEGGTIFLDDAYGEMDNCYLTNSRVNNQQGGAVMLRNSNARQNFYFKNSIITNCRGRQGAAIYAEDNIDCYIINSLFYANIVTGGFDNGGTISCGGAVNMIVTNSTITANIATGSDGAGLSRDGSSSYNVSNCIVWDNQVSNVFSSAAINVNNSIVGPITGGFSGTSVNSDPLFTSASDFTLQTLSPCINTGTLTGAPVTDLTGFTRVGNPDMGSFEFGSTYPTTSDICSLFLICTPPTVLTLTADNTSICEGTGTNITIASSENGVLYQLVDDGTAANIGTPVPGNGVTISLPTGNLTADTDFTVTAYDPTFPTCTSTLGPISITVNATPTVTVSSNAICEDGALTLTPTTGGTWASNNTAVATVTPAGVVTIVADGSVDFTFTDGNTCTATTSSVTVNPTPTVTVSSNAICEDGTLTLTPTTGGTWASNNTAVATVTPAGVVTIVADGSVDFTFTDGNTCTATTSSVTVNPTPTVTVSSNAICEDGTLTLTPTTAGTWASNNPAVATVTPAGVVTIVADGAIDFTFTDGNTCTATTSSVTVNPTPTVTVSSNAICEDGALTLTPTTGGTWVSNNTAVAAVTPAGVVTIVADGSVDFTFTDGNTCTATTSSVTVNPTPTVTVSSNAICEDGALTLTPTTGGTWASNNTAVAAVTPAGVVTIVADGAIDFTFTDGNTCTATTSSVTVNPTPTVTVSSNSVCEDGSLTLTPTTGGTWASNNTAVATVTPAGVVTIVADGSVDFTFTDGNTCAATTSSVTVNPTPTVTVSSNAICEDGTLTLTPTTGGTWASNNTGVATVTPAGVVTIVADGSVDFTFTDGNTCTATTSSVTVNPTPTITPLTDISICEGDALTIIGNPGSGVTYSWTGPNSYTASSQSPTVSSNATNVLDGSYTLNIDDGICTNTSSLNVVVNPLPMIDISSINPTDPTSCGGTDGSITGITATGAPVLSYEWNGLGSQATPDLNAGAGSYTITVTDGNTCQASAGPFDLSDPTPPAQPSITLNPTAVCEGGSFSITVDSPDPSATYAWTGPNGYTGTGSSITLNNNTATQAGNYTVTPTIGGCTGGTSLPVTVTVNTLPFVDVLTNNITIDCSNPYIYLDGSNSEQGVDITYVWSTSNGTLLGFGLNDLDSTSTIGDYTLTVLNTATGCEDNQTVTVTENATLPTAVAGSDITLNCNDTQPYFPITLDGNGSDAGVDITYNWTTSGSANITGGSTLTPDIDAAGTFELTVTNTSNNCSSLASVTITLDTVTPLIDLGNTVGTEITCTSNLEVTLDASATTGNNTFAWSTTNGNITSQIGSSAIVDAAGNYTLTVLNSDNNCSSNLDVPVTIDTISPTVSITNPGNLDCNLTPITLDAIVANGTNETYIWNTSETTGSISVNTAGNYSVTVTNDNGCISTLTSTNVIADPAPVADFSATPISGNSPLEVSYTDNSTGNNLSYSWDFGDGNTSTLTNPLNTFTQQGSYTTVLTVTDNGGCAATSYIVIEVLDDTPIIIPNIFSPNQDGTNDLFSITGGNIERMEMTIFNRWGQLMFEQLFGNQIKWDGRTLAGVEVPEGTYYYIIIIYDYAGEQIEYTGYLQLIR